MIKRMLCLFALFAIAILLTSCSSPSRTAATVEVRETVKIVYVTHAPTSAPTKVNTSAQQYVLNTNTKKFHYPYCRSVKDMKEKNKKYVTMTRQEIISMGYSFCGNCHP